MCELHKPDLLNETRQKLAPKRRKLWELDVHWHCSVIGTCISHDELRKLAHKCKAPAYEGRTADYKLHGFMVGHARHSQGVGRVLHKFLERKYARTIKTFAKAKTSEEVEELWLDAFDRGYIPGPFWAVMTHQASSYELLAQVYGEVHMLSHLEGASNRADHREIADLKTTIDVLQKEMKDLQKNHSKSINKRDHMIGKLKHDLSDAQAKAARSDELEALLLAEKEGQSVARLEKRIDCLTARVIQETDRADQTQARLMEMELKFKEARAGLGHKDARILELEHELLTMERNNACMKDQGCPGGPDLCGRCIAYIGGQTKQAAFFRDYVEKQNGQFLHHDGGLHDGQARLLSIVAQADAVMFPVTCVSHEATREIKKICAQQSKPFVPLRTQGLGAFTRGLEDLAQN